MATPGKNNDLALTKDARHWHEATLVKSEMTASDIKSLTFSVKNWTEHKPGQHYDIRLTSESGYQAARSYSIASPPNMKGLVEFGIQLLENGEVSPYLFDLQPGENVEIKGPLGGHFIWDDSMPGPLVLIGGGSGIVPFMSMIRHVRSKKINKKIILIVSAKTLDKIPYYKELESYKDKNIKIVYTLTSKSPPGWKGYEGRINMEMVSKELKDIRKEMPMVYICGPTQFVESIADGLIKLGLNSHEIRTERFG
ncbi:oxidoreductase [Candidatus Pacearchaeota archaeon]|nr:oxidoreductase [Candidatus Pacearchaeota archaeon]